MHKYAEQETVHSEGSIGIGKNEEFASTRKEEFASTRKEHIFEVGIGGDTPHR